MFINLLTEFTPKLCYFGFRNEVQLLPRSGRYASAWTIHGMSSALRIAIRTVYPQHGGYNVRKHLQRMILPRLGKCCHGNIVC